MGSRSVSEDPEEPEAPFHIRDRVVSELQAQSSRERQRNEQRPRNEPPRREVFRIGRSTIPSVSTTPRTLDVEIGGPTDAVELSTPKESPRIAVDDSQSVPSKGSSSKDTQQDSPVREDDDVKRQELEKVF